MGSTWRQEGLTRAAGKDRVPWPSATCPVRRFSPESEWGANNGLKLARELLEPIKAQHPWISYADLWTLAGATAIEELGGGCRLGSGPTGGGGEGGGRERGEGGDAGRRHRR